MSIHYYPIALTRLVKHMQRWWQHHYKPYHLFLSQAAMEQASLTGCLILAQLIKAGYFSVIVTTNSNKLLEQSLKSVRTKFTVLNTGEDTDTQVSQALEDQIDEVCLVKLPRGYEDKTATIPLLSPALSMALQRYFNDDLIVIGPVALESRLMEMVQPAESSSTYYCIHEPPSTNDSIVQLLKVKASSQDDFLIVGEHGHFDMFFQTIDSLLRSKETRLEIGQNTSLSTKQRQEPQLPNNKESGPESRDIISGASGKFITDSSSDGWPFETDAGQQKSAMNLANASMSQKADILLVTVTEIETQALLNRFPPVEKHIIDQIYYDFGSIGPAHTVMVRSTRMGPFSAIHCVERGIDHFSPRTVIMVGIAFGLHPKEQEIGDILVAQQIMNCDLHKIRTGPDKEPIIVPRGTVIPVTDRLLNCFQDHLLDWKPPPRVSIGPIFSSSRLIDHEETRNELSHYFPEAIGGEMEGHGLCDACLRKKVDWILVKAICDWADGNKGKNKESNQRLAADNASRFVLSVIRRYGLF